MPTNDTTSDTTPSWGWALGPAHRDHGLTPDEWHAKSSLGRGSLPGPRLGERWSYHYDCCVQCGETSRAHSGKGLCTRCRMRTRYARAMQQP